LREAWTIKDTSVRGILSIDLLQAYFMSNLPSASAVPRGYDKEKVLAQVRGKYMGALANDTKWNELITFFRSRTSWRPSYRSKWVSGHISEWDTEWHYHLPFPFVGVEWFDIGLHEHRSTGNLLSPEVVDHSDWIVERLAVIGFEFEVKGDMARIWGYSPKSYDDFPPDASA